MWAKRRSHSWKSDVRGKENQFGRRKSLWRRKQKKIGKGQTKINSHSNLRHSNL
ncbi:hypothetical protein L873DRAFT_1799086 [Choiromyces venosus 120613-1]|uniref:Uncharacterized protein n=1 Tax=Choiromyces venosus 120613-1 TaxID=1336337 RepID=A0A3N4K570_9PEZI|nr:hypothetical protein L873DRAFT_1799086 [Choiromyces venosus 120613-1]